MWYSIYVKQWTSIDFLYSYFVFQWRAVFPYYFDLILVTFVFIAGIFYDTTTKFITSVPGGGITTFEFKLRVHPLPSERNFKIRINAYIRFYYEDVKIKVQYIDRYDYLIQISFQPPHKGTGTIIYEEMDQTTEFPMITFFSKSFFQIF